MRQAVLALVALGLVACSPAAVEEVPIKDAAAVKKDVANPSPPDDAALPQTDAALPGDSDGGDAALPQTDTAWPGGEDAGAPPDSDEPKDAGSPDSKASTTPDTAGYIGLPDPNSWLFVVRRTELYPGETALIEHFKGLGVAIRPLVKDAFKPGNSAYNPNAARFVWGRKGVIVSQLDDTTTPMVVNAFKGLPVPMVALYQKNFNMSGDAPWMTVVSYKFGTKTIKGANYFESGTQLTIADPTHPLAAGLSGTVTVATAGGLHWGAPQSAEAIKVASVVGVTPPGYGIFAYPPGATMDDGSKAAGARVGLFFDPSNGAMTAEGWKLLEAALDWAASQ